MSDDFDPYGWHSAFNMDEPALSVADAWATSAPLNTSLEARYQKISVIGEGGMGRVWLGRDVLLERNVAIKEPLRGNAEAARLMREARLCAKLDHLGVVAIYDVYEEEGSPHFVMSLVRGLTLQAKLKQQTAQNELLRHVLEVCDAVGHAHRLGVIHRDLTPRNIVIDQDNTARVIDWGLAVALGEGQDRSPGTRGFASPEQERGEDVGFASDVWSLGAILRAVLLDVTPNSHPKTDFDAWETVDPELKAIVECATAHDPRARYMDAVAMAADLRRWFEGLRVQAYQFTSWDLVRRFVRSYRKPIVIAAVVMVSLVAVGAYGAWTTAKESSRARLAEDIAVARAAEILLRDAQIALRTGHLWRAKKSLEDSHTMHPTPESLGLGIHLAMFDVPKLQRRIPVPMCRTWILGSTNETQVCQNRGTVQGWREEKMVWEFKGANNLATFVRVFNDEVHVLDNHRQLTVLDQHSGEIIREDGRVGEFATPRVGVARLDFSKRGWLDRNWGLAPCTFGMGQGLDLGDHAWLLCNDGQVFRADSHEVRALPLPVVSKPAIIAEAAGHGWMGTRQGLIQRLDGQGRTLDLGESLEGMDAIAGTSYILVIGGRDAIRVLDAETGDWIASFPDDVDTAFPGENGVWLVQKNAFEFWSIPTPKIARYRTGHGLSSVQWSLDGTRLGAADGGGFFHLIFPFEGRFVKPLPFALRVGRDVAISPHDGDFRALSMDLNGMWRMRFENGGLSGQIDVPYTGSASGIGVFSNSTVYFVPYLDGIVTFVDGVSVNHVLRGQPLRMVSLPYHAKRALLVGENQVWTLSEDLDLQVVRTQGAMLGAMSQNGWIAVIDDAGIHILKPDFSVHKSWKLPLNTTALTWRGDDTIITGHLDGQIMIWDFGGTLRADVSIHEGRVSDLSVSPDLTYLGSSSWDSTIAIFDLSALSSQ